MAAADRIVLPGVGAFADCRAGLYGVPGMVDALQRAVIERGKPFLGICVGMQLMATRGLEHGDPCRPRLDPGRRRAHRARRTDLKIPHMGWNELGALKPHAGARRHRRARPRLFRALLPARASRPETVLAMTEHGGPVTAVVARDNLAGTQFHPEKSQATGLR